MIGEMGGDTSGSENATHKPPFWAPAYSRASIRTMVRDLNRVIASNRGDDHYDPKEVAKAIAASDFVAIRNAGSKNLNYYDFEIWAIERLTCGDAHAMIALMEAGWTPRSEKDASILSLRAVLGDIAKSETRTGGKDSSSTKAVCFPRLIRLGLPWRYTLVEKPHTFANWVERRCGWRWTELLDAAPGLRALRATPEGGEILDSILYAAIINFWLPTALRLIALGAPMQSPAIEGAFSKEWLYLAAKSHNELVAKSSGKARPISGEAPAD